MVLMFTRDDLGELETLYKAAKAALPEISYPGGYPRYPDAIKVFMDRLSFPPWDNRDYDPGSIATLIANIDEASEEDLRSVLTSAHRSERFGDGNWAAMLECGDIDRVIARARALLETS